MYYNKYFLYYNIPGSGALFRKNIWLKYHGFDNNTLPACDLDYFVRLLYNKEPIVYYGKRLIHYRYMCNDSLNPKTMIECLLNETEVFYKYVLPSFRFKISQRIVKSLFVSFLNHRANAYYSAIDNKDLANDFLSKAHTFLQKQPRPIAWFWHCYYSVARRLFVPISLITKRFFNNTIKIVIARKN